MSKVALIVKLTAVEGRRDELFAAFDEQFQAASAEPGTEVYALHADTVDSDVLWFYELYSDQDALALHAGSQAMKAAGPRLKPLLAGRPEITRLAPLRASGLAFD
ncbi:MAG TPA: putative quinol monooxygenase [Mycobacteriales bacterium]|jgi:quinol monooxygenase YgiN|nr:putative quinol monooxygenase [Mycobacteriales bacterium]